MGCAVSTLEKEAAERSKKIDQELRRDGERYQREVKLLLLGKKKDEKNSIRGQRNNAKNVVKFILQSPLSGKWERHQTGF